MVYRGIDLAGVSSYVYATDGLGEKLTDDEVTTAKPRRLAADLTGMPT